MEQESTSLESTVSDLALTAYKEIYGMVSTHFQDAVLEAGNYLITTFYGGDHDRAKANDPVKKDAFNHLGELILAMRRENPGSPSKSWIYNSVKLACDARDLEDYEPYTRISPSHKILLLPISELSRKKQMISIINEGQFSVRQFKDYLAQDQPASITIHNLPPGNELTSLDLNLLHTLRASASTQISKYQSKADQYKNVLEEIQTAIENLQEGGGENTNGEETGGE